MVFRLLVETSEWVDLTCHCWSGLNYMLWSWIRKDQLWYLITSIMSLGQPLSESAPAVKVSGEATLTRMPATLSPEEPCVSHSPNSLRHLQLPEFSWQIRIYFLFQFKNNLIKGSCPGWTPRMRWVCACSFIFNWKLTLSLAFGWKQLIWEVIPGSTSRGWGGKPKQGELIGSYYCEQLRLNPAGNIWGTV